MKTSFTHARTATVPISPAPYAGPFGEKELKHLLRRTLFGVSHSDLNHFSGKSLEETVDELLTFGGMPDPPVRDYPKNRDDTLDSEVGERRYLDE